MPSRRISVASVVTAAHNQQPVKCPVCSSPPERFQRVDKDSLQNVAVDEGGTAEEETFDGVRLQWSEQAKKALRGVPRGYMRRNVKARIEKSARSQKIATITNDFATPDYQREYGRSGGSP